MKPNRINFTKAAIDGLPAPEKGKLASWYDAKAPGLMLMVTPGGAKTFYVYRKVHGKPERIKVGRWPDLSIEQARRKAAELLGMIATGGNPQEERRRLRKDPTFAELFAWYMERHARPNKRTADDDAERFRLHLRALAGKKASMVTRGDIRSLHASIGERNGRYTANRTLALVRCVFNKAIEAEEFTAPNPAAGIKPFPEKSRERWLLPSEQAAFLQALEEEANPDARDFFLLLLFTGARRSNVQAMRWDQIDLAGALWTIPRTKNGKPQTVPLEGDELAILRRRLEDRKGSPWVFPGKGRDGHMTDPRYAWERLCERAGLEGVRIHDLRRTLGSMMVNTGATLPVIGQALNHLSPQATTVYARLSIDPVRQAKSRALRAMRGAAQPEGQAEKGPGAP